MIVVWTQPGCGPCYALKAALKAGGVLFDERSAADADDATLADWRAKGWSTPVVEHVGGSFAGFDPAKVRSLVDSRRTV